MSLSKSKMDQARAMGSSIDSFCVILDALVEDQTIDAGTAGRIKHALGNNHGDVEKVVQPTKDGQKYVAPTVVAPGVQPGWPGHTPTGQPGAPGYPGYPNPAATGTVLTVSGAGPVGGLSTATSGHTTGVVGYPSNAAEEALVGKVGVPGQVLLVTPANVDPNADPAKDKPKVKPTP